MFGRSWGGPARRNVNRRTMHLSRRQFAARLGAEGARRGDTSEDLAGLTVSAGGPPNGSRITRKPEGEIAWPSDEEKIRPSGAKAGGPSAALDLEPHAAWLADLQSFPGFKHEASGCRTDRAPLPCCTARREVCRCDGPALADAQRGTAKLSRRQDLHAR